MFILKLSIKYFIKNFVNNSILGLAENSCNVCIADLVLNLSDKTKTGPWETWFLSRNNLHKIILKKEK